jgi:DNA (cytosine-5)-methyltransferase 1
VTWYGDNDAHCCAWLRELMAAGLIGEGVVDGRDVREVRAEEVGGHARCHFFAGIGGWEYALALAGWPADRPVWTASCPCQPFSTAGKGRGEKDARHLWPVLLGLTGQCRPATIFGEQVASRDGYHWLARVRDDLEAEGYAVGCADLPACGVGAPHIRQRLFWVAVADDRGGPRGRRARNGCRAGRKGRGRAEPGVGGRPGGLAHPGRTGIRDARLDLGGSPGTDQGREDQRERLRPHAGDGDTTGGLGDATDGGQAPLPSRKRGEETFEPLRGPGRWGSPNLPGCEEHGGTLTDGSEQSPAQRAGGPGFWDESEFIPCRDGRWRRTQPGLRPLAHGLPGRVALLRGAGNSIVPEAAALFIRAFLDCEATLT